MTPDMNARPRSPWRKPLVREIALILLIKLVLLMTIKSIWFTAPTVPPEGSARMAEHLLATPLPQPLPAHEETPR